MLVPEGGSGLRSLQRNDLCTVAVHAPNGFTDCWQPVTGQIAGRRLDRLWGRTDSGATSGWPVLTGMWIATVNVTDYGWGAATRAIARHRSSKSSRPARSPASVGDASTSGLTPTRWW